MTAEQEKSRKYSKRARSQYNETPSVAIRVIDYKPNDEETPTSYSYNFINPYIPLAMLSYNVDGEPMAGVTGLDIDVVDEMTQGNVAATFGFDLLTILSQHPTLLMLYSIFKTVPSDLSYIFELADRLPDECWIEPGLRNMNNVGYATDIYNNGRKLLILERR
jgi:hypothetical protein